MNNQTPTNMLTSTAEKTFSVSKPLFIVEDNNVYARLLKVVIQTHFPEIKEIEIFPIGELCLAEMDKNPGIVIMDYFLNTEYTADDEKHNGLAIIKRIKSKYPDTNILLLSAQTNIDVALEATNQYGCSYVRKGKDAFNQVEDFIRAILNHKKPAAFESWT
jgi:two-component system OmpR family response regulator